MRFAICLNYDTFTSFSTGFKMIKMMNMIKKYPVRDYLSVETGISHARHAVGMTPSSDASLRGAIIVGRSFSTERYIPMECSLITGTGHTVETQCIASLQYTNNKQLTINNNNN